MSNYQILPDEIQDAIRSKGIINDQEVVLKAGDLYCAENILTKTRRIIKIKNEMIFESNKKILKG